jgi:putative MATE family efflux protein
MRTPMVIVVTANVINVAVEVVFVYVLHLGIAGSAWGTVLAQAWAAVWSLAVLAPRVAEWGATRSLDVGELGRLLRFGRHLFVRTASLLGTFTLATAVAARVGRTTLAGHHLALQLDLFLALVVDCLAVAGQALVGTALGRGDGDDARAWGRRLLRLGSAAGAALAIALLALSGAIPHAYSSDAGVVGRARLAIAVLALMQLPGAVAFVLDGVLIGAADTRFQQWANVAAFIVFAPFGIAVLRWHALGIAGIWTGLFAWMATRALANAWRFRGAGWTTAALRPGGGRRQPSPRESP